MAWFVVYLLLMVRTVAAGSRRLPRVPRVVCRPRCACAQRERIESVTRRSAVSRVTLVVR
jgi:hypothetical protein